MAHSYGSLAAEWVDGGSLYGDPTPFDYNPRLGHQNSISPEALQILDRAFSTNPYPSSVEISLIATRTQLEPATVRIWFNGQFHRISKSSDPTSTTAPLHPPGPVSVQNDIDYTASWLENKADHVAGFGAHGHPPIGSTAQHYLDLPNHSVSTSLPNAATEAPINAFSNQFEEPWFPGSRTSRLDDPVNPTYHLPADKKSSRSLAENDASSYHTDEHLKPERSGSLRHGSVSSGAKSSHRSRHKAGTNTQGGVTACPHCTSKFTGTYRQGNWARHVRQQHSGNVTQPSLDCVCRICGQQFKRQDAKRKHEWNKHTLPDTRPIPRRQGASNQGGTSHAGAYETRSNHETLTCTNALPEEVVVNLHYQVPAQTHHAHKLFAAVQNDLGRDLYDLYCRTFLGQCQRIAEQLGCQQSDLFYVFTLELGDMDMVLLPGQRNLSSASENHMLGVHSIAALEHDDTGEYSGRGKGPVRRTSKASARTHPYSRRPSKKSAPGSPIGSAGAQSDEVEMKRAAIRDLLLSRASELYAQFQAQEFAAAAHERINVEDISSRINNRLEELRIAHFTRINQNHQSGHGQFTHQPLASTMPLHTTPVPVISGVNDFLTPPRRPQSFIGNLQLPASDNGTGSISHEYQTEDTSPGFQSFAASSRTSYDFGISPYMDTSQFTGAQFSFPAESAISPISPHSNTKWLSPFSPYLDVHGSLPSPQQLLAEQDANAQMSAELDLLIEPSLSESHYALSSYAPDDDI